METGFGLTHLIMLNLKSLDTTKFVLKKMREELVKEVRAREPTEISHICKK